MAQSAALDESGQMQILDGTKTKASALISCMILVREVTQQQFPTTKI